MPDDRTRRVPVDLVGRIHRLLVAPPGEAVAQVSALAEETFDLIEKRLPGLDTVPVRLALGSDRTTTG